MAHGALGHLGRAGRLVPHQELPFAVLFVAVLRESACPQELARTVAALDRAQFHQEGTIGVLLLVVQEERHLFLMVEFREDDLVHGHPERAILALMHGHPLVGVLGHLVEIGAEDHHLGAVMAGLGGEVAIGRAGHVQVAAHDREELRVVPIRALLDIGLLAPHFGAAGGEIAIPVVEAEVGATQELDEARARGIAQHGHGRDGAETCDAVGPMGFDGVDIGGRDELVHLIPGSAAEAAFTAGLLVTGAFDGIVLDAGPGRDGILILALGLLPQVHQRAAHVGELHPERAVEVPREADAALAPAGFVGWDGFIQERVVEHLHFPGDDAFLDVDVPAAAAGAVHAVGAADHFVVGPAIPVELLPGAGFGIHNVGDPVALLTLGHGVSVSSSFGSGSWF